MDKDNKKILLESEYEDVFELDNHYYINSKKERVCVLPYTITDQGLLGNLGIVEKYNEGEDKNIQTLLIDYLNTEDSTNMVGANRILRQVLGIDSTNAADWMYLGTLTDSLYSVSAIRIYAVDITGQNTLKTEEEQNKRFKLMDSSEVVQSNDVLFLSAFLRLFNFFYVKGLST